MESVGIALKGFFKEKGVSQKQLSETLGVSQPYINALFSGQKEFGKKQAKIFGDLFGISPNWLLTGEGDMLINAQHSTVVGSNIKGNGNQIMHNDFSEIKMLVNEMAEQRKANTALIKKKDEQIDRLLSIIEKTK